MITNNGGLGVWGFLFLVVVLPLSQDSAPASRQSSVRYASTLDSLRRLFKGVRRDNTRSRISPIGQGKSKTVSFYSRMVDEE